MTPSQTQEANQCSATLRRLSTQLSASAVVERAACEVAASCLEILVAGRSSWTQSHSIIPDLGVTQSRISTEHLGARAMTLAADALRRLALHGSNGTSELFIADRLDELARAILRATEGLDRCEQAMLDRLEEPVLSVIALTQRRDALRSRPALQLTELRQLSAEVAREREQHDARAIEENAIRAEAAELAQHLADATQRRAQLDAGCAQLKASIAQHATEESKSIAALTSLNDDLLQTSERVAVVRIQLNALREDPREEIRNAVTRALQALPADAFDRTMGARA